VKPKKKSNVVFTALLFLLCAVGANATSWPERDTIILDGETIYIEKNEVTVNVDSLQEEADHDIRQKPVSKHLFGLAVNAGVNGTFAKYATSLSDMKPLDTFLDHNSSSKFNFTYSVEASCRLWRMPVFAGTVDLALHAGIGYNEIRVESSQMDESPFTLDSIVDFQHSGEQLSVIYFTEFMPGTGIGEVDTALVAITSSITKFRTLDIPLKLRCSWKRQQSPWSILLEVGIVRRLVLSSGSEKADNYVLNENARFLKLSKSEFREKQLLRPLIALGVERRIVSGGENNGQYWSVGSQLSLLFPSTALNSEALYYFNVTSSSLTFFLRRTF